MAWHFSNEAAVGDRSRHVEEGDRISLNIEARNGLEVEVTRGEAAREA